MEHPYPIRAHHGMCIAFFQGKGYSSEFTAHMREMIQKLENNASVRILARTDAICAKCPNNQNGICETENKAAAYDRQVLERCGLSEGAVIPYAEFLKAVSGKILLPGLREEICGSCQWNDLCKNIWQQQTDT